MNKKTSSVVVSRDESGAPHNETEHSVVITPDVKLWYYHGLLHRVDGPAYFNSETCYSEWWYMGCRHRVDGPAIIYPDGTYLWCYNNKNYSCKEEWFNALTKEEQVSYLFKIE